jgi:hypothetical protein
MDRNDPGSGCVGGAFGQMTPNERHPEREQCVFTASEVPEACGIGYGSRAAWVRGDKRAPNPEQKRRFENGSHGEHAAATTYRDHLLEEGYTLSGEVFVSRETKLGTFGASPDGIVYVDGAYSFDVRAVEYKCIDGCGSDREMAPIKANHVLQLATQVYTMQGPHEGHLLYYQSNGRYVCYRISVTSEQYEQLVFPWLEEALRMRREQSTTDMPRGEAQRRREAVVKNFLAI